tara:strand:+ start:447 stop:746 length:300 start_codon:yes stop_codon:yes gene_type:complete
MNNNNLIKNVEDVKKWYLGIQAIFKHVQLCNNWSKQEAWDKLKIELINAVGEEEFVPDDLEWVKGLLLNGREPTTEEALRVSKRYRDSTPLIDSLAKLF